MACKFFPLISPPFLPIPSVTAGNGDTNMDTGYPRSPQIRPRYSNARTDVPRTSYRFLCCISESNFYHGCLSCCCYDCNYAAFETSQVGAEENYLIRISKLVALNPLGDKIENAKEFGVFIIKCIV